MLCVDYKILLDWFMKKKILAPLALLTLVFVAVISFYMIQKQKKPDSAPLLTPASAEAPASEAVPSIESEPNSVPTRPATAEEVQRCEAERPLTDTSLPLERSWQIGRNNVAEEDICLATVSIRLKNGKTKELSDSIIDPNEYMATSTYYVERYFKEEGFFAFMNTFMEGGFVWLVNDETGDETGIQCSLPVFSPSKASLFSLCTGSDGEASTNSIGVWDRDGGSLKQVYSLDDLPWTPINLRWVDDNTIVLDQETVGSEDSEKVASIPAKITRTGENWAIDPPVAVKVSQ